MTTTTQAGLIEALDAFRRRCGSQVLGHSAITISGTKEFRALADAIEALSSTTQSSEAGAVAHETAAHSMKLTMIADLLGQRGDINMAEEVEAAKKHMVGLDAHPTPAPREPDAGEADWRKRMVRLDQCPIGLFWSGGVLCVKTEYCTERGAFEAYIVSSGEFFWGESPQTVESQHASMVVPIDIEFAERVLDEIPTDPVVVIGKDYSLLWASGDALTEIVTRTGVTVGTKLYAHPPAHPTPAPSSVEGLREAVGLLERWKTWGCGQVGVSPFHDTREFLAQQSLQSDAKFKRGDHVEKISGSRWRGIVVGEYSTSLTPEGYAVESDTETGSVQIYPAKALRLVETKSGGEE